MEVELARAREEVLHLARGRAEDSIKKRALRQELAMTKETLSLTTQELNIQEALLAQAIEGGKIGKKKKAETGTDAGIDELVKILQQKAAHIKQELQTITNALYQLEVKCHGLVTGVIPHVCKTLLASPELEHLLNDVIDSHRFDVKGQILRRLKSLGHIQLNGEETLDGAGERIDEAEVALRNAQFPYVNQVASNPGASVADLYDIRPQGM